MQMSRRNGRERWRSEAEMFASFVVAVKALGFTCYPESCGHDLVMVAPEVIPPEVSPHVRPGDILVVEGKLVGSVEVLAQSMPPHVRHAREREMWPSAKVRPARVGLAEVWLARVRPWPTFRSPSGPSTSAVRVHASGVIRTGR